MIALVQVTHPNGVVHIFEADTAKPDRGAQQEATPYQVVTDAIIRHSMFGWGGVASEDSDNATAWARGGTGAVNHMLGYTTF